MAHFRKYHHPITGKFADSLTNAVHVNENREILLDEIFNVYDFLINTLKQFHTMTGICMANMY